MPVEEVEEGTNIPAADIPFEVTSGEAAMPVASRPVVKCTNCARKMKGVDLCSVRPCSLDLMGLDLQRIETLNRVIEEFGREALSPEEVLKDHLDPKGADFIKTHMISPMSIRHGGIPSELNRDGDCYFYKEITDNSDPVVFDRVNRRIVNPQYRKIALDIGTHRESDFSITIPTIPEPEIVPEPELKTISKKKKSKLREWIDYLIDIIQS